MEDLNFLEELCSYEPSPQNEEEFGEQTIEEQVEQFDTMFDQLAEAVAEGVIAEFENYKNSVLLLESESIFERSYEITFYREVFDLLSQKGLDNHIDIQTLYEMRERGTHLLNFLWGEFLREDVDTDIGSWESLRHFIHIVCQDIRDGALPF